MTDIDHVARRAAEAHREFARTAPRVRARALTAIADALAADDRLVPTAMDETGLSEARLTGELKRTTFQLKEFADTVLDGGYLDVRIDSPVADYPIGPRPDVRRYLAPVGPVLNFAASNFPLAFSVLGGDTAAALAAGCSVVVKAHPGHPALSDLTAELARAALDEAGISRDTLQLVHGQDEAVELLKHPLIRAASFTGSVRAGRVLANIAAGRPDPIPFFGELGSVNPVVVTASALADRGDELITGYVGSVSGSAGQLCTKPGFLFVPDGEQLDESLRSAAAEVTEHRLLNPQITDGYRQRRQTILDSGVRLVSEGSVRVDESGNGWVTPTLVAVSLEELIAKADLLRDEAFGPLSIVVEYPDGTDLAATLDDLFQGNLTATVQLGPDDAADPVVAELVHHLSERVGRVLFAGWPTGVSVTPAMQHGGPWPATTNDSGTSVGSAAISRFLRPVAYQSAPQQLLPPPLRDDNPWGVPQQRH
ncbi:aldehyde dehydrogenase (NADP(+)) [Flexivirga meconopsidis]|uniref:aldehyde dehydrogenase (NADP(+)) n=1 Tax=Flexivirga meconopsidis TaxID=2977121 RepID=UPI00223FF43D|nr:aldehyde dehydrogenase (NADP(+)) [Flexivirga meconopsidis]